MTYPSIVLIDPIHAEKLCRSITATLPEWFGIPEANERYAKGMLDRQSFAAQLDGKDIGMITLEFPSPNNANIYWLGVQKNYHGRHIGTDLINAVSDYCREQHYTSLTVETLSPKENDANYLATYHFYEKKGFKPLFELYGAYHHMIYLQKKLDQHFNLANMTFIDLTHTLSSEIPHWSGGCGFEHQLELDYDQCTTNTKFRVQKINMFAGVGTHMDAPLHCIQGGFSIAELPLHSLITNCIKIDVTHKATSTYAVSPTDIEEYEQKHGPIPPNTFVVFYTGWDRFWADPEQYRNNLLFPSISREAAEVLLQRNIAGLGIDTLSPDRGGSDGFPVHELILGAEKYIIENIAHAKDLPAKGAFSFALPMKTFQGAEAPMRLIAGIK